MEFLPLTRQELELLKPSFQSSFPAKVHPKVKEVGEKIVAYMDEHLRWPSEAARLSFLRMQMETCVAYFVPEADDNLIEMSSAWFTVWHWLDDTFEHQIVKSEDRTRMLQLIYGTVQPDKANHLEWTIYDMHNCCREIGNVATRKLFGEVVDQTVVWLKTVLSHRSQEVPKVYETLEDWMAFRRVEIASQLMWPFIRWAMLLDIPAEILSRPDISALEDLVATHGIYVNDLWSLRKELNDIQAKAVHGINLECPNTVVVYASKNGTSLASAVKHLEAELLELEHRFVENARETIKAVATEYEDKEVKLVEKYVYDGLRLFMSGNIAWSNQCGRYNDLDIAVPLHYAKTDAEFLQGQMGGVDGGS